MTGEAVYKFKIEIKIKYSIIIPTYNEEYFIEKNLALLRKLENNIEIIVSDGGSSDATLEICKREKVVIVSSGKGRGEQMNKGAAEANGEILLFLHADTFLPDNAFELLDNFFLNDDNNICRFLLGFDINHWFLDMLSSFSKYDTIFTRFGDSGIVIRNTFFKKLNGFSERNVFEDVKFFSTAAKHLRNKSIPILPLKVISSARRFIENGTIRQTLINSFLFIGYLFKVNPEILSRAYNKKLIQKKRASLIVFLRYPQIGKVKTRLAETTTKEFALYFYKKCATKLISEIKRMSLINKYVFFSEKKDKDLVKKWLGRKFIYSHQEGDDLGLRMKNAFHQVFSHAAEKVVIVGTDILDLNQEIIEQAIVRLDKNDIVIGPSKDGGYYLLGAKKMYCSLFEDIEFSTYSVLSDTISKIEKLGLRYSLLPQLQDIDTEDDLVHWLKHASGSSIKKEIDLVYNLINGRINQRCIHCGE